MNAAALEDSRGLKPAAKLSPRVPAWCFTHLIFRARLKSLDVRDSLIKRDNLLANADYRRIVSVEGL